MTDTNDYNDDHEDNIIDDDEAQAAEQSNASDTSNNISDVDIAEAESLTVTAKQHIREQLEDEVARFLAQGGAITQVPPSEDELD